MPIKRLWGVDQADVAAWTEGSAPNLWDPTTTPVVVGRTVYLASTAGIHAVDAASGEHRWSTREQVIQSGDLLVADGTVVTLGRSTDAPVPDSVVGVDVASRSVAWRSSVSDVETVGPYDGRWVYVGTEAGPRRLDPASGEFGSGVISVAGEPLVDIAVASDGTAYAVDGWSVRAVDETGATTLQHTIDVPGVSAGAFGENSVALVGDTLVIARPYLPPEQPTAVSGGRSTVTAPPVYDRDGVVVALDAATGERRWTYGVAGAVDLGLATGAETVYAHGYTHRLTAADGRARGFVEALDVGSGCRLWRTRMPSGALPEHAPALADGRLYLITYGFAGREAPPGAAMTAPGGAVRVLDAQSGEVLGGASLSDVGARSGPAVANGRIYLSTAPTDADSTLVSALGSAGK